MNWLPIIVLFQFLVSASAGLVGQVRGPVNVSLGKRVGVGQLVETGPKGFVELQLNPEGYLRVRENSSAVFDSVALANIAVRVTRGNALIDSDGINPEAPIKVTAGNLQVLIRKSGLYLFSKDSVRVFKGHVELTNGPLVQKGYEATANSGAFTVKKLDDKEIENPYAPDQIKIFVEPRKDEGRHTLFMNTIFSEICRDELKKAHDIAIVTDRKQADYVLVTSGGFDDAWRIYVNGDLIRADGTVIFSSGEISDLDNFPDEPLSIHPFLTPSHIAVEDLIYDILLKTGWR